MRQRSQHTLLYKCNNTPLHFTFYAPQQRLRPGRVLLHQRGDGRLTVVNVTDVSVFSSLSSVSPIFYTILRRLYLHFDTRLIYL